MNWNLFNCPIDQGIRVTAIAPGYVDTPQMQELPESARKQIAKLHPLGRLARTEEVADMVSFLLSEQASFVTGSFHLIDGGYTAV